MKPLTPLIALSTALALWGCATPSEAPSVSRAPLPDYRFGPSSFKLSNWARTSTTSGIEGRVSGTVQGEGRQLVLRFAGGGQLRWVSGTHATLTAVRFVLASSQTGETLAASRSLPFAARLGNDRDVIEVPLPAELRIDTPHEVAGRFSPPLANTYLRMELVPGEGRGESYWVHGPITLFADLYTPGGHAAACTHAATPAEAVLWACLARLHELLDAGADPYKADAFMAPPSPENLATPLEHAVASGDIALLRRLLRYGADPNQRGQDYSAFELAVVLGRVEALDPLLRHGGRVDATGPHGFTPLMLAAQFNQPEVVRALLRAGADANQPVRARSPRGDGRTALMHALEEDKVQVRRLLLDAGADPLRPTTDGFSPFLFASEHPRMHAFKEFLARGYPVNASTGQGFFAGKTPFMSVAVISRAEDLEELLRLGADPRMADRSGHDAVYWARRFGREDNAKWIERRLASGG